MVKNPKISFGTIVLNGMPFVKYCLRQLYPFAHEIIVVEGASRYAKEIATKTGHSKDETLKVLREFKQKEDKENKLKIITKKGFWLEKDEQSKAYAKVATGDYLWQVDIDEFYKKKDMQTIIKLLQENPQISGISFKMLTFWGGLDYGCDGWYLKNGADIYYRLFKWEKGYKYVTHRPPTVADNKGEDLKNKNWIDGGYLKKKYRITLYHYSLLFPKQVIEKEIYYSSWARKNSKKWTKENFLQLKNPFRVHNVYKFPSWLLRYKGTHPEEVYKMIADIEKKKINVIMRDNQDVDKVLNSKTYRLKRFLLQIFYYIYFVPYYKILIIKHKLFEKYTKIMKNK